MSSGSEDVARQEREKQGETRPRKDANASGLTGCEKAARRTPWVHSEDDGREDSAQ